MFMSFLNAIYKLVLCVLRRYSKDDKLNSGIAGAVSALSLLFDEKDRRKFFALLILSRALVSRFSLFNFFYRTLESTCSRRERSSRR